MNVKCVMEENAIQINGDIIMNVDVSVKKRHVCEKDYVWNLSTCSCETENIMDDSALISVEVIDADRDAEGKSNDEAK